MGQMVKMLQGCFDGEASTVKILKNGMFMMYMSTYGQMFEKWFNPDIIRPLADLEVMRGMSRPTWPID